MAAMLALERILTPLDHIRLTRLASGLAASSAAAALGDLLAVSDLVPSPSVPADVVTMNSQVLVADEASGARAVYTVCYPGDAQPADGAISVLAPLGTALLGLRVGEVARWVGPAGEPHAVRIVDMLFQPEAAGDYTT